MSQSHSQKCNNNKNSTTKSRQLNKIANKPLFNNGVQVVNRFVIVKFLQLWFVLFCFEMIQLTQEHLNNMFGSLWGLYNSQTLNTRTQTQWETNTCRAHLVFAEFIDDWFVSQKIDILSVVPHAVFSRSLVRLFLVVWLMWINSLKIKLSEYIIIRFSCRQNFYLKATMW